jgi:hypothetical protein
MFLFFYPVVNSKKYDRHTFDGMNDEVAAKMLLDLKDNGETVPHYDMENEHPNGRFLNMVDFAENCNDQDIQLEHFWTIVLNVSYEKMRELVDGKDWWKTAVYPNEEKDVPKN